MIAAENGQCDVVHTLLEAGAIVNDISSGGLFPRRQVPSVYLTDDFN